MDWRTWHDAYDRPESVLAGRLQVVQEQIGIAISDCSPGPVRVVSLCAGQGRDLIGALVGHPRKNDVRARLVELDPENVAVGRRLAEEAGLADLDFQVADAAFTDRYKGIVPADVVIACGTFGNLADSGLRSLISYLPQLCRTGGSVLWTQSRRPPNRVPKICAWLRHAGFAKQWLSRSDYFFGVGRHRFSRASQPLSPGASMFDFRSQT